METVTRNVKTLNPFRPGIGLFPSCLAGRVAVLNIFSSRLYSTITGSPRNILVCGNKRMGKTCLLIKMEEISFTKKLLTVSTITSPERLKSFVENIAVRLYAEVKAQGMIENGECEKLLIRLQTLPFDVHITEFELMFTEFLLTIWKNIDSLIPAIFISIDDIDLVDNATKALLFIHNVTQNLYRKNCPVIFAASCSADFYERIKQKHPKLTDRYEPIEVTKLLPSSLENAIRVPLWELEIPYDEAVVKEIARLSGGFPFYLQHLAHYVFEEMQTEIDTLALRRGYEKAMRYLKRDIFAPLEQDIPFNEKTILVAIYEEGLISFSDILKRVRLPRGSVASSLRRLKEKQMIQQDKKRYRIYDKLFGEYIQKKIKEEKGEEKRNGLL
ncbi:MAG: hypothetical protein KKH94_10545 [Candidatus Omnitrophica bacterium]|nr:hypothetical protein [Candidatus Omnitrophota bacterium]